MVGGSRVIISRSSTGTLQPVVRLCHVVRRLRERNSVRSRKAHHPCRLPRWTRCDKIVQGPPTVIPVKIKYEIGRIHEKVLRTFIDPKVCNSRSTLSTEPSPLDLLEIHLRKASRVRNWDSDSPSLPLNVNI